MSIDERAVMEPRFDERGSATLNGTWEFRAGELEDGGWEPIVVPALWEATGHLDLDGTAWYRLRFSLDEPPAYATLRFGAVMDLADVTLNGVHLGSHEAPFTPFAFDVGRALVDGENELLVRVFDPPLGDPDHIRTAHGKQGWANATFPSRPSLYMTYGGIWQEVTLERHGALVIDDVWVNGDPDDLRVRVEVRNVSDEVATGRVNLRLLGGVHEETVSIDAGAATTVETPPRTTDAPRWRPSDPVLHDLLCDIVTDADVLSHVRRVRFGLRTVAIREGRLSIDGAPYRMKSVLVQGFRTDGLYDEGSDADIRREVQLARDMGFNTLRLHIKAFDPRYLDICDEVGMFVHCDLPIAEPIAYEEMGEGGTLDRRCVTAVREQVRRDRNHPCIVLWTAMNEIGDERREIRTWEGYERFVHLIVRTIAAEDHTRPIIENDWVEPDPDHVFESPILTAHWYGRLHAEYLDKIDRACTRWEGTGRQLFVTEFGDWGLPAMPILEDPPFWDVRAVYAADLALTRWPDSVERFAVETQRYQGMSDRLQTEVFRRHDAVGGYCLTELTDVPHELNGVLDLDRRAKPAAVREVARANQRVLPIVVFGSFVARAGADVRAGVHIANDGPALRDVELEARFGDAAPPIPMDVLLASAAPDLPEEFVLGRFHAEGWGTSLDIVEAHRTTFVGEALVSAPDVPGRHDFIIRLRVGGAVIAENRYPIHVVGPRSIDGSARIVGEPASRDIVSSQGLEPADEGPLIVCEQALDRRTGDAVGETLATGGVAVVLAQDAAAASCLPIDAELSEVATAWGSTVFFFTAEERAVPSLPARSVLVTEAATIHARSAMTRIGGDAFPSHPIVIAYKPNPKPLTGTIVGEHHVGDGRLIFCQYRLEAAAAAGDEAGTALLRDLIVWAQRPNVAPERETTVRPDGRRLHRYSFEEPT